jgi:hypothetical protein
MPLTKKGTEALARFRKQYGRKHPKRTIKWHRKERKNPRKPKANFIR